MPSAADLELDQYCLSDPGREPTKQVNEDAARVERTRFGQLALVCDGMGGHAHGQAASRAAVSTIFGYLEQAAANDPPSLALVRAIQAANQAVYLQGSGPAAEGRPGSTCVAVLLHEGGAEFAHVGDSRAYLIRDGQIHRMTRDHSVVQQMVDSGLLNEQQALEHPDSNRITRALGMAPNVEVELRPGPSAITTGDAFVLASDGLTDLVSDQELLSIYTNRSGEGLETTARALVDTANMRGGHDNITVILLRVRRAPLVHKEGPHPSALSNLDGLKTVVDPAAHPTQIDPLGPDQFPTAVDAPAAYSGSQLPATTTDRYQPPSGPAPTRTGTEPGLQQSPFYEPGKAEGDHFISDYPSRITKLSRHGKLLLVLAALFTVLIVGSILLWWIVAALQGASSTPGTTSETPSPLLESDPYA